MQDRLVKELRIENVSSIEAGNVFLLGFISRFNGRFAVRPAKINDLHQTLRVTPARLDDVLCHREQRHVGEQLTLAYDRKQLILERRAISEERGGQYVDLYDFPDGRLEVPSKGRVLPYRVFDKDQRVNPAAIVENKRLGHALSLIKAQQDQRQQPRVKTNSEKNGYMKRPPQSAEIVAPSAEAVQMTG